MITNLHVKNLALIDEADVNFGPGLNILTGETGAGKSILIGSINAALGHKMTRDMQRKGTDSTLVELVFDVRNEAVRRKLRDMDVEFENGSELIISRKFRDGRSTIRLNGETCTAARIREISAILLDIHGQHEHQSLLYPDRQLEILDAYGAEEIDPLLDAEAESYRAWRDVCRELGKYQIDEEERERNISFLQYEIGEIEGAALKPSEEEELEKKYRRMSNSRKIAETLGEVTRRTGEDGGAGDLVGSAVRSLASVVEYDESLADLSGTLTDIDGLLSDFNRGVADYLDSFSFDEQEFYETEKRLDLINDLKAKYGRTIEDILAYGEQQRQKLDEMQHFDERRAELEKKKAGLEAVLEKNSEALSAARQKYAAELSDKIREGLLELNFLSVDFSIRFERTAHYTQNGCDAIEFLISTNPGEPVKPLKEIVSGGELSRIMLAIKTILADRDETETLIFDEIDTGISGRTAQKVSEKMARIARNHQVICITHLAQIAAMADEHFVISKEVREGSTVSHIRELPDEETTEELARILGGAEITKAVMDNASEMKKLARERKKEL